MITFPFLTAYDPPGTSEGTLDPLGLYQIADQLAMELVPAVRERMQRIRFLTAMTVGAIATRDLADNLEQGDASPSLVWEWLVVEALIRAEDEIPKLWGVPGTLVTRRALNLVDYLDSRNYLKTPRIFGFHGVYKRLAVHLGLVDVYLRPGPAAERVLEAWARGLGWSGFADARPWMERWTSAVRRSLGEKPPRTKAGWGSQEWAELARAFDPAGCKARERRCLTDLLLASEERPLGALPILWQLQSEVDDDHFSEEALHDLLEKREPGYRPLLEAIRAYEAFARSLLDAFDLLRAEAAGPDAQGYVVSRIAADRDFLQSVSGIDERFERAYRSLAAVNGSTLALQNAFGERFRAFAEPMTPEVCARVLCDHHERVQKAKSAEGKRPWFDRLGEDRIYIRHGYRDARRQILPGRYVHDYRGQPIRHFFKDLS